MQKANFIIVFFVASVFLAGLVTFAILQTQTILPSGGAITEGLGHYSYIIYRNGTYTQARDSTGVLKWSSTDANFVMQSAIDNNGEKIFIKTGTYSNLALQIPNDKNIMLSGEGWGTHLIAQAGQAVIGIRNSGTGFNWQSLINIEDMWLQSDTGTGVLSDLGTDLSPRMTLYNLQVWAKYGIKVVNPYKMHVSRYVGKCLNTVSDGRGIWLIANRNNFHSGDSYFENINIDMDGPNAVGILLDATPTQSLGILNLITFNKIMIYGGSNSVGVKLDASNDNGGSIEYIEFTQPTIEDFGTSFVASGSVSGTGQSGHVSEISLRGDVYWYGSTYGFRFINQVTDFFVQDIDVNGGTIDIKEDERSSDSMGLILDHVSFSTASWGSGEKKVINCPGYQTKSSGTRTISGGTSVTFGHGLAGTPDTVNVSFKTLGYGSWSWSATSTQITITVQNSGTYTFAWEAEFIPP